jgi:hypothetical protein
MPHYFKHKLNSSQHWFSKVKSTTANLVTYLDFFSSPVGFQRQVGCVYFDLSSAFDLVSHTILLHIFRAHGFSVGYLNWFHSYLSNRQSSVRISDALSLPFEVLSGVPQEYVSGPLLFNISINDFLNIIKHYKY